MLAATATASLSVALRGTSSLRMTAALPSDGVSSSSAVRRALHFACPSCGDDLLPSEQSLRCAAADCKTTLDVAKEGHVHLAKPQKKAAAAELDAIARASLAFHAAGGFEAQFAAVADEVARALSGCPPSDEAQILIAGCGEGSCVRAVQERVDPSVGLWAVDTNKLSVRYAAKRQRSARFAVAPLHALPFADGSLDVVLSLFAPSAWEEVLRVLRPGGACIVARAGSSHLDGLRVAPARDAPKQFSAGLAEQYGRCRTTETYRGDVAAALLEMTPAVRRADDARRAELAAAAASEAGLTTEVDFIFTTHRVWLGTGGYAERDDDPDALY